MLFRSSFTGCTRGLFGTSVGGPTTSHIAGVLVYQATNAAPISYLSALTTLSGATLATLSGATLSATLLEYLRGWNTEADRETVAGIPIPARLWQADTFGQDLVLNVRNNAVYYWQASSNLSASGSLVPLQPEYPNGHAIDMSSSAFGADSWAPTIATKVLVTEEKIGRAHV